MLYTETGSEELTRHVERNRLSEEKKKQESRCR